MITLMPTNKTSKCPKAFQYSSKEFTPQKGLWIFLLPGFSNPRTPHLCSIYILYFDSLWYFQPHIFCQLLAHWYIVFQKHINSFEKFHGDLTLINFVFYYLSFRRRQIAQKFIFSAVILLVHVRLEFVGYNIFNNLRYQHLVLPLNLQASSGEQSRIPSCAPFDSFC